MRMNIDEKEMHRLEALKEIAELLNEATNLQEMLGKVLHTLLQVMNLQTGWIFFIDESGKASYACRPKLTPSSYVAGKEADV